jgi:hypothetical protein
MTNPIVRADETGQCFVVVVVVVFVGTSRFDHHRIHFSFRTETSIRDVNKTHTHTHTHTQRHEITEKSTISERQRERIEQERIARDDRGERRLGRGEAHDDVGLQQFDAIDQQLRRAADDERRRAAQLVDLLQHCERSQQMRFLVEQSQRQRQRATIRVILCTMLSLKQTQATTD